MSATEEGGNLTRMVVVPFATFENAGKIPRRSSKDQDAIHVPGGSLEARCHGCH